MSGQAYRCTACHAYGWHTVDCPVAARETLSVPSPVREPEGLDVERLARAMAADDWDYGVGDPTSYFLSAAQQLAAEYTRLAGSQDWDALVSRKTALARLAATPERPADEVDG